MKQINLLPWREEAQTVRRYAFLVVLIGSLISVSCVAAVMHFILVGCISHQEYRNQLLSFHLKQLDGQISDMKKVIANKQIILKQISVINSLLVERYKIINILSELGSIVPQGVVLTNIKREGILISLEGKSESDALIANMMRDIERATELQHPVLKEIKGDVVSRFENNSFVITLQMR